jgi:hypothetical protein
MSVTREKAWALSLAQGRWVRFTVECDSQTIAWARTLQGRLSAVLLAPAIRTAWVMAGLMLLVWIRCPSILARASFWGEDGWVWYPTCYYDGWRCLLIDHTGYLQTVSMLVALLSQPWPLAAVPSLFAFASLIIQAAPAAFLISGRMAAAIPSLPARVLLALLLVAVPGMSEVYVNLTNAQWHLSLLGFLVLAATVPPGWAGRVFDSLLLVLCGLSGPFCAFLAPVAWIWWWGHRSRWAAWRGVIITATAAVQFSLILLHGASRHGTGPGLGVSLHDFNAIVVNTLAVGTIGWRALLRNDWGPGDGWLGGQSAAALTVSTIIVLAAFALTAIAFVRGRPVLRCFLIFVALECVAMLVDGLPIDKRPLWQELATSLASRYSFHPTLAWLAVLVSLFCDRLLALRIGAGALLAVVLLFGVAGDWKLVPLQPMHFPQEAARFAKAPPGTVMQFPTRPMFYMTLTKK